MFIQSYLGVVSWSTTKARVCFYNISGNPGFLINQIQ